MTGGRRGFHKSHLVTLIHKETSEVHAGLGGEDDWEREFPKGPDEVKAVCPALPMICYFFGEERNRQCRHCSARTGSSRIAVQ